MSPIIIATFIVIVVIILSIMYHTSVCRDYDIIVESGRELIKELVEDRTEQYKKLNQIKSENEKLITDFKELQEENKRLLDQLN